MRIFLKVPGNVLVARENLIKQETALAELDLSIDEWTGKLESFEGRGWRIQQKLSEHMAAILVLKLPGFETQRFSEEQTPPRSPAKSIAGWDSEKLQDAVESEREMRRDEVESIRIYAGSGVGVSPGVASLLKSIEQEIDLLEEQALVSAEDVHRGHAL